MSNHSTNTFTVTAVAAAIAAAASGDLSQWDICDNSLLSQPVEEINDNRMGCSGRPILFYNHAAAQVERTVRENLAVDIASIKMQLRYKQIEDSFKKNSEGFPADKYNYLRYLANEICRLPFVDNLSSYNDEDGTIDTQLKLSNGLRLSISQFLDDATDAPVVFSIHRKTVLLVSDELPMSEIVDTLQPLLRNGNHA